MFFSYKNVNLIRHDARVLELLRKSSKPFLIRLLGVVCNLGFTFLVGRYLGPRGAGLFFLSLTVVLIASVIGRLGLDSALLRLIPTVAVRNQWGRVSSIFKTSCGISLLTSVGVTIVVFLLSRIIAENCFHDPALVQPLRWMTLIIVPFNLLMLQAHAFKAVSRPSFAIFLQNTGIMLASFLILAVVGIFSTALLTVCQVYVVAGYVIFLIAVFVWNTSVPSQNQIHPLYPIKSLLTLSIPLFCVSAMNMMMGWIDTVMIGFWHESPMVGLYGVANRVAAMMGLLLAVVSSVVAPRFSSLFDQGRIEEIQVLANRSVLLLVILGMPVLLVYLFFSDFILSVFGSEFARAGAILKILSIGQFINISTGSVGFLLMMTGHEKIMMKNIFFATGLNFVLNYLLVPQFGGTGAAVATASSVAIMNLTSSYFVMAKLGINIFRYNSPD